MIDCNDPEWAARQPVPSQLSAPSPFYQHLPSMGGWLSRKSESDERPGSMPSKPTEFYYCVESTECQYTFRLRSPHGEFRATANFCTPSHSHSLTSQVARWEVYIYHRQELLLRQEEKVPSTSHLHSRQTTTRQSQQLS